MVRVANGVADLGSRGRAPCDPIGLRGLPVDRRLLDRLAYDMIERLKSAGNDGLKSRQLVFELGLRSERALRLLVAYARVHHHVRHVVGVPGDRYYWGPAAPIAVARMVRLARRMGRCWFFVAASLAEGGAAQAGAQMVMDFLQCDSPGTLPTDELSALVSADRAGLADFLEAFIRRLRETPDGAREVDAALSRLR